MLTRLRFVIFTLLALMLSLTVSAQRPTPSALTLANMTPAGVMLYASVRTDPGFIETLDGLITRLTDSSVGLPTSNAFGGLLASEGIRGWLGDSAAVYALQPVDLNMNEEDLFGLLVEITDPIAVAAYLEEQGMTVVNKLPDGTITLTDGYSTTTTLTENLLLMGGASISALPALRGETLADSPRFQQALTTLPAGDYPLLAYFDPSGLMTLVDPDIFEGFGEVDIPALAESLGVFAAGMRQLDGQTYTFDIGWAFNQNAVFTALNLPEVSIPTPRPLNVDFLRVIPADAQLVLHGGGLWSQFEAENRARSVLINALIARMVDSEMAANLSNTLPLSVSQWLNAFVELMIRGSLNLTSAQLSAALDGDSAFALRFLILTDERVPKLLIEPGAWFASRDNGSADLLAGGSALLETFGLDLTESSDSVRFNLPDLLSDENSGNTFWQTSPMIWLATDTLTYIGADTLTLENKETLVAVPRITERIAPIRPFLFDDATGFAWLDIAALSSIINEADSSVQIAASPFDSLFISARQNDSGLTARFAFRLK